MVGAGEHERERERELEGRERRVFINGCTARCTLDHAVGFNPNKV